MDKINIENLAVSLTGIQ